MCVLIEAINVIIRQDAIERSYPGGMVGYEFDCPNPTYCADMDIVRVGFMSPYDVQRWVAELEKHSIILLQERQCIDIAVVDQVRGPTAPCDWLEFGRQPEGYTVAWLKGTVPHEIAVPKGWNVENSLSRNYRFIPTAEIKTAVKYGGREGNLDIFTDPKTGEKLYMGRPPWKD